MAVTKIHSITSTVGKAVKYICDPNKTDDQLLVFGYGCQDYSAEIDFELTRQQHESTSKNLARHMIQSFSPGEVTPEQAHEIGKRLADELLTGEYEYILATHVDRGHVHNHIIFNEINFVTGKTFSTEHDRKSNPAWKQIKDISDRLCEEHGLSVIKNVAWGHGKSYYEWMQSKMKRSWKDKLRDTIDDCIMEANSFEDFLQRMQEHDYEYKLRGETLSFKAKEQERFIRCRKQTLGWFYEPEQLHERIRRSIRRRNAPVQNCNGFVQVTSPDENNIGLQRWAMLKNMQELSEMVNAMTEFNCKSPDEIKHKLYSAHGDRHEYVTKLNSLQRDIADNEFKLKHIKTYWKTKPVYQEYKQKNVFTKKLFYKQHEREIVLYKNSINELQKIIEGDTLPNAKKLELKIAKMKEESAELNAKYDKTMSDIEKLEKAYMQYQTYRNMQKQQIRDKNKANELE